MRRLRKPVPSIQSLFHLSPFLLILLLFPSMGQATTEGEEPRTETNAEKTMETIAEKNEETAASNIAPPQQQAETNNWNVGGGLLIGQFWLSSSPGIVANLTPRVGIGVERRLHQQWWLGFDGFASLSEGSNPVFDPAGPVTNSRYSTKNIGARLSLRHAFNLGKGLTIAPVISGSVSAGSMQQVFMGNLTTTRLLSIDAELGVMVEKEVTEGIHLRLSSSVLSLSYSESRGQANQQRSSTNLAMRLSPELSLRFVF